MTNYAVTLKTLEEMRSRFSSGFSSSDKANIEKLYLLICGKRVRKTGCRDCWRDAFIETMTTLKKLGKMPKKPNYILKAGVIIHPHGTSKFYSLNNIPDDVAENWLGQFPAEINKFESYPTDWESRVKARQEGMVAEPTKDELKDEVEKLNIALAEKDAEIEKLNATIVADNEVQSEVTRLNDEIAAKDAEITTAKEAMEAAVAAAKKEVADDLNKTIAELKTKAMTANDTIEKQKAEIVQLKADLAAAKKATKKADGQAEQ